jgi:hypothetical protein
VYNSSTRVDRKDSAGAEEKKHLCIHDVGVKRARLLTRNSMNREAIMVVLTLLVRLSFCRFLGLPFASFSSFDPPKLRLALKENDRSR